MTTLGLDAYGDLDLQKGRLVTLTDAYETAQKIQTRLSLMQGEWFLDTREGVPLFRTILVKNPDVALIRRMFERIVADVPGVASVQVTTDYSPSTRSLSVAIVAVHVTGAIITGGPGQPFIVTESEG